MQDRDQEEDRHGRKIPVKVKKCTTRLVSGKVKFTIASHAVEANISRAGVTYATGRAIPTGTHQWQLVLTGGSTRCGRAAIS